MMKKMKSEDIIEEDKYSNASNAFYRTCQLLKENNELDRKRSSSFDENLSMKQKNLVVKKGLLKKKGLFFYNNRVASLNVKGIFSYFDPKNLEDPKGEIDLKHSSVIVKLTGRSKDYLEIITKDHSYCFKVSFNSSPFSSANFGLGNRKRLRLNEIMGRRAEKVHPVRCLKRKAGSCIFKFKSPLLSPTWGI